MRFRGGGVGHTSTRAATDIFKNDRDDLDAKLQQARKESIPPNVEDGAGSEDENMDTDGSGAESEVEEVEVDEEDQLSDSELVDYGYEPVSDSESGEEEEDRDGGEEDDTTVDELDTLGYADH